MDELERFEGLEKSTEPPTTAIHEGMPCSPHDWAEPMAEDIALTCRRCGHVLDKEDITIAMRAAIQGSIRGNRPYEAYERFRAFFAFGYVSPISPMPETPHHFPTRAERLARREEGEQA